MYKFLIKKWTILILFTALIWLNAPVFGIDLLNNLTTKIQKFANEMNENAYLENIYKSEFSKDPFRDMVDSFEDVSMETKIGWLQSVQSALYKYNCNLDDKKIIWILYHFSDDFRSELTRSLKMDQWEFVSRDYVVDEKEVYNYCLEYYNCVNKDVAQWTSRKISAFTPKDPLTSCKEFFLQHYEVWSTNTQRAQNIKNSWAWFDKYWNSTINDSPYDIMSDMWVVWSLLFDDVELAITPVLYHLPLFSISQEELKNAKNWGAVNSNSPSEKSNAELIQNSKWSSDNNWGPQWSVSLGNLSAQTKSQQQNDDGEFTPDWKSEKIWYTLDDGYDDMLEWLLSLTTKSNKQLFYGNMCESDNNETKVEAEPKQDYKSSTTKDLDHKIQADKEFQEAVKFMLEAVNQYWTLSEEEKQQIEKNMNNLDINLSWEDLTDWEKTEDKIKSCWKSCEWLRVDKKASCMMMCACGERKSPIFDPNVTPWLWPIFMIRFCAIPWVNAWFSVWWKRVISIEEMVNEIFGVVDKLSNEWRLWTWTKQRNFLDSSTKNINFAQAVSFTINITKEKIFNKMPKQSEQYKDKIAEIDNSAWQYDLSISNRLDDPATKNHYRVVGYEWEVVKDFSAEANPEINRQAKTETVSKSSSILDQWLVTRADHYLQLSEDLSLRLDQQWYFWADVLKYINEWREYAEVLYAKK